MTATTVQAPAKIQQLLNCATELGMSVTFEDSGSEGWGRYTWTISSGKPHDFDRIWVYWSGPGPNGGRTGIRIYRPYARYTPSRITKATFQKARSWMWVLSR